MESKAYPLIVAMTQVCNDAWVLRAFLEATSLWADNIIIDRMSTDGSREIAQEYPKVILIDDHRKVMDQAATKRLLFEAARKIDGDKLLFALDTDKFLTGDFVNTDDWKKVMNSEPGDAFCWRWMNLKRNDISKYTDVSIIIGAYMSQRPFGKVCSQMIPFMNGDCNGRLKSTRAMSFS